jgi:hypothetical protein
MNSIKQSPITSVNAYSKMRNNNNETSEKKQNDKFYDRLKDYSTPISYDSDAYKNWNVFIIFLSIVTAYYTPYRISFETARETPWYTTLEGFEIAFDLIFIVNMFLHAFHFYSPATISTTTCYTDGFKLRLEIFIAYLTKSKGKRFLIDLVSSIPWEFLVYSSDLNTQFGLGIIRIVRLYWYCYSYYYSYYYILTLLSILGLESIYIPVKLM